MDRSRSIPSPVVAIARSRIDLDATLRSGQAFCWQRIDEEWRGWIGDVPCRIVAERESYLVHGPGLEAAAVERYFGLDLDLEAIVASFPDDPWLKQAIAHAPGLRLLAQEPWETLASFICSAVKQIPQIEEINRALRREFGTESAPGLHAFPSPAALAAAGEMALRRCKLGFRARGLHETARQVAAGEIDLAALHALSTNAAREELVRLRGVGPKIADCVLLFAYRRGDAFPIDVWVERVLRQLYFRGRRVTAERLRRFPAAHFGLHSGYAQQYLFHWVRTARPPEAFPPKTGTKKREPKRK
jgi:N-glycosylase/DNA lyase